MDDRFTVFIDESGEAGIEKVRSDLSGGASPYMTLGAALISNRARNSLEGDLERIASVIGKKSLHCSQLNHFQILYFIREISKRQMRLFGVISHKETLGGYKAEIADDSTKYYNKCAQYLLERVGWFMEARKIPRENLDIVFEKANVDYDKMRNLLRACQSNPKHPVTMKLRNIDINNIKVMKKNEEPILQLADLVAHCLYKCVDRPIRYFGITEPRYLKELAPRFFGHPESHAVLGAGLYCVHSTGSLKLDPEVEEVIEKMLAIPPAQVA